MADKAAPLPASSGGLMRFFEDETKARENATAICKESYQQQEKEQHRQKKYECQ